MNETTSFSENLDTLFSDLHNLVKSDTVLGTPVSVGDKTLVPVMVIDKNSVTLHSVAEKGNMASMMEKIPQALAGIGQNMTGMGQGQQQGQQQNQTQGQQNQQKSSTNSPS